MTITRDVFTKMQDERIRGDVNRQIARQREVRCKDISVKVSDSNVILTGYGHYYFEKGNRCRLRDGD